MFQVKFLVDDKRLGEVLQLVSGKVHDLTQQPVVNVRVQNGGVQAVHPAGTVRDALIPEMMRDAGVKKSGQFTTDVLRATIEKLGGSPHSMNTHLTALLERKLIKRVGRGVYMIVSKG